MAEDTLAPRASEFLLYTAPDGGVRVSVLFKDETAWLPQKGLAELFGVTVASISRHLKNIFESAELEENSVVTVFVTTAADDKTYRTRSASMRSSRSATASTASRPPSSLCRAASRLYVPWESSFPSIGVRLVRSLAQ
jgi:hypothetical protein